ncbi:MAG: HAMP domain-containing histidine kinase [Oscillospiraceae bacterium]|nr:HAMP domain-containing histidine kinase [Oscillospiraceae bacterium]
MEEQRKIIALLDQLSQPGFVTREDRILQVNQAAGAMLIAPGDRFSSLLKTGSEDYAAFASGQLSVTLTVGGQEHSAVITRMDEGDLVLLDPDAAAEEFRSMALVSMELRKPLMQAITAARQMPADAKMNQSLMQMLRTVSNMADISRYTASAQMELRDIDSFLLEVFEKAKTLTEGRARITFESLKQPVFTLMDPEQLERAVWNILSNSLKFLPADGIIRARLTRKGNRLYLTVEDNAAVQITPSELFNRYLRQPGIEDSRYGLGLGLAIVRAAAANHGGTLLISTGKETGMKVTLTVALRQDSGTTLRSPLLCPDYTGGWDHALVELSDCLGAEYYTEL